MSVDFVDEELLRQRVLKPTPQPVTTTCDLAQLQVDILLLNMWTSSLPNGFGWQHKFHFKNCIHFNIGEKGGGDLQHTWSLFFYLGIIYFGSYGYHMYAKHLNFLVEGVAILGVLTSIRPSGWRCYRRFQTSHLLRIYSLQLVPIELNSHQNRLSI